MFPVDAHLLLEGPQMGAAPLPPQVCSWGHNQPSWPGASPEIPGLERPRKCMHSWNNSSCLVLTTLFSKDCWPWAWTCLSTSSGEKPSYGVPGEGRRRWDEAAPFGQSSWVTSALKGPWKRQEMEKLFFAHPASLHSCTSVSHAADNSTGLLSNSVAESWWWHGFCWQPAVPCLGSGTLLLFPSFPAYPGCRRILWKKAEYQVCIWINVYKDLKLASHREPYFYTS